MASTLRGRPDLLAPFDRIVIATGAQYRFGLGPPSYDAARLGRRPLAAAGAGCSQCPALRDWFYHRARRPTGAEFRAWSRPGQKVVVIGDAAAAGKSRPAILSAFEAAFHA